MIYKHEGAARESRRGRYDPEARAAQPSRRCRCTEYLHDSPRHIDARLKVDPERRREIASTGGQARAAMYHGRPLPAGLTPPAAARITAAIKASDTDRRIDATNARLQALIERQKQPMPDVWAWPPGGHPPQTPEQKAAARAARAAASRPARRAAARARAAAERAKSKQ